MSEHQVNQSVEHEIFLRNYTELTGVLNPSISSLSTHFVSKQVITIEDEEMIHQTLTDKAKLFLWKLESPLKSGITGAFYVMLDVMDQHGNMAVKSVATKLRKEIDDAYSQSITNAHHHVKRLLGNDEVLNGVQVNFDKEIGRGSYAVVYEAEWKSLSCVVKVFHPNQPAIIWKKHKREIQILQDIRHPNIIQLLGFVLDSGSNVLSIVMERMDSTLTAVLSDYFPLPFDLQVGVLHDVAVGLNFLHTNTKPIIHRDLSSNNILLTSHLVAKISDLGLAKHLKSTETETGSNDAIGAKEYMPPEVLGTIPPQISPKTDIFSFGVIVLQVATGKYPEVTGTINADTEIDRRKHHISMLENSNPLQPLSLQCLQNDSCKRPSANALCDSLSQLNIPKESVISLRKERDMMKQSKEGLKHLSTETQFSQSRHEIAMNMELRHRENLDEQEAQQTVHQASVLEDQNRESSTKKLISTQEIQGDYSNPHEQITALQNQLQQQINKIDVFQKVQDELKNECDATGTQVKNLQNQLQILRQMLDSQSKMYDSEQSKAHRRIKTLEAEYAYLKNEIAQQTKLTGVKTKSGMNHRQPNDSDQILYDNSPWVDAPRTSHGYQFHDAAAAAQPPYSTWSSETSDSSDSESYGSPMANRKFDYHDGTSPIIRPRSITLSQNHRSQITSTCSSCTSCNWSWQQENSSLSQPTNNEYLDSQSDMTRYSRPQSLSQEYNPFHENIKYSSWGRMPSYRPTSKELERNTNSLSFYRTSSSLGSSRVELSQTTCTLKVVTAHGKSSVKCERINRMSELHLGKRVIVYRYYQHINEYGTVRKLNVIINKKPCYVGVELDLPSGNTDSDGAINGIRYFKCKPQHATFIHLKYVFKIRNESPMYTYM